MKNTFSLVSTYMNWSSLSLSTPRMRKITCSDTLTIQKHPAAATESVFLQEPLLLGPILGQTGMVE